MKVFDDKERHGVFEFLERIILSHFDLGRGRNALTNEGDVPGGRKKNGRRKKKKHGVFRSHHPADPLGIQKIKSLDQRAGRTGRTGRGGSR